MYVWFWSFWSEKRERKGALIGVCVYCTCLLSLSLSLLPSVITLIARGVFCGAKYTHHTFTPTIKHIITTTANKHPGSYDYDVRIKILINFVSTKNVRENEYSSAAKDYDYYYFRQSSQ